MVDLMTYGAHTPGAGDQPNAGTGLWRPAAAALVPWAAFLIALVVADPWSDATRIGWNVFVPVVYLGFVGLPSAVPLVSAKRGWMRLVVLVVMTAVAVLSAVLVTTTDDAQAGLAVLWVPLTALALTGLIFAWRIVESYRSDPGWSPTRSSST
jgi:hypothetical protein